MGSYAEHVGRFAGSRLLAAIAGEIDDVGRFEVAVHVSVDDATSRLSPVIVTQRQITIDVDPDTGNMQRRETRTIRGKREDFEAAGIAGPQVAGTVTLPDGTEWAIDVGATVWNASMVTLGLARKVLVRQHEHRRADG